MIIISLLKKPWFIPFFFIVELDQSLFGADVFIFVKKIANHRIWLKFIIPALSLSISSLSKNFLAGMILFIRSFWVIRNKKLPTTKSLFINFNLIFNTVFEIDHSLIKIWVFLSLSLCLHTVIVLHSFALYLRYNNIFNINILKHLWLMNSKAF